MDPTPRGNYPAYSILAPHHTFTDRSISQLRTFKSSTSTTFRSLTRCLNCLGGQSSWVPSPGAPVERARLTRFSRFRSSRTYLVLGVPGLGRSLTTLVSACSGTNLAITLWWHPSRLALALHDILPFFIPIILHISPADSLRLAISHFQIKL